MSNGTVKMGGKDFLYEKVEHPMSNGKVFHTWSLTGPDGHRYAVTEEGQDGVRFLCQERHVDKEGALFHNLWIRETEGGLEGGDIEVDGIPIIPFSTEITRMDEHRCDVAISEMIMERLTESGVI